MIAIEERKLPPASCEVVPWRLWRCQVVSLLEIMEQFKPEPFLDLSGALGELRGIPDHVTGWLGIQFLLSASIAEKSRETFQQAIAALRGTSGSLGLVCSSATAVRLGELLSSRNPDWKAVQRLAHELHGRLSDELANTFFLTLTLNDSLLYRDPRKDWEEVIARFPSAVRDVEEAGACLALERNTACIFHLMRIMELGLRALAASLDDSSLDPRTNPSWQRILSRGDKELEKPIAGRVSEWKADETFFSTAHANLRAVQFAWRNPTMHVGRHYDSKEARQIWQAVLAFMGHLATKLSE